MNPKLKTFLIFFIGAVAGILFMFIFNPSKSEVSEKANKNYTENKSYQSKNNKSNNSNNPAQSNNSTQNISIDELTKESLVIDYLKKNKKLPDYYITKNKAKQQGWNPGKGNLCDVLPGKAIGGDKFSNREKNLPTKGGRQYYEADLNYNCNKRNADRVVYSDDGLIFVSHDHYKTFEEQ